MSQEVGKLLRPVNHQVVLQRDVQEDQTEAGIYITSGAKTHFRSGVIVALAADCDSVYEVGQRVGFQKFAGTEMEVLLKDGSKVPVIVMDQKSLTMIMDEGLRLDGGA